MVLFNRIDLAPFHGTGLDVAFRAAEDIATRVAGGLTASTPLGAALTNMGLTQAKMEPTDEGALLTLVIPGFGPNDVDINVKRGLITIRGKRGSGDDESKVHTFNRTFKTPFPIDADAAVAKVEHGILELRLPRHASDEPKSVRIEGTTDTEPSESTDGNVDAS